MALQIETAAQEGYDVIKVSGEVDLYTSPELRTVVMKAVPKCECGAVALDLSQVPYMDSSGVATLVEGLKASQKENVAFFLLTPSSAVLKVLQLARLDSVFQVRDAL